MMRVLRLVVATMMLVLPAAMALAQSVPLQGGPVTSGHVPMYASSGTSQPVIVDSGGAGGGGSGVGLSELGLTARGTGTAPYANAGTGQYSANFCDYDAPVTNANGFHYLCMSPNAQGGGLLAYGAGGTAPQLPLNFIVNGTTYTFPWGVIGPSTATPGHLACWNNATGSLLSDCGPVPSGSGTDISDTLAFYEPGFAFNEKRWKFEIQPGSFYGKKVSDDQLTELNWLQVNGNGVASIPDIFLNGFTVVPKFKVSTSSEQNVATFERTSAPTDQKRWRFQQTDTDFALHAVDDADSAPVASITASRSSGTTLGNLIFAHPNIYQIAAGPLAYQFRKTDAPADQKRWSFSTTDTQWKLVATNDANTIANDAITATRSGAAITNVTLASNADIAGGLTLGSSAGLTVHHDSAGADAKNWNLIIDSAGTLLLRTRTDAFGAGSNAFAIARSGTAISHIDVGGPAKLKNYTVGTLPACNSTLEGAIAYVTDSAASPVYNAIVAGGGSTKIEVICDNTNWRNS